MLEGNSVLNSPKKRGRPPNSKPEPNQGLNGSEEIIPKETIKIAPLEWKSAVLMVEGTAPYVSNKFSALQRRAIMEKQEAGSTSRKGKKRDPKDFDAIYKSAMHVSTEGWYGLPATGFHHGMIDACRMAGFKMTMAKQALKVQADGIDADDATPLIRMLEGKPIRRDIPVRLATGATDILARPFFMKWKASIVVEWDADVFTASDIVNLLNRAGQQVGIGAGRPFSKNSAGMGWGTYKIAG